MIHREGRISVLLTFFVFAVVAVAVILAFGVNWITLALSVVLLGLFCFTAYFFRDPHRGVISGSNNEILSSADGEVVIIKETEENEFLHSRCIQVSVFMSLWSVHVNYYPAGGRILYSKHHHGNYFVAWYPKSSEKNERTTDSRNLRKKNRLLLQGRRHCSSRSADGIHKIREQGRFIPADWIGYSCKGRR